MMKKWAWILTVILISFSSQHLLPAEEAAFNGLDMNLGNLCRLSDAKTRSISPENYTGEKGKGGMADPKDKDLPNAANSANAARELGQGWKVNPRIKIEPGQTFTLGQINEPGAIQHIWMTISRSHHWRYLILRMYWDGEENPSVEVPACDFFACGWCKFAQVSSLPVAVNPGNGFNCYWCMPFRTSCKITMENIGDKTATVYYQID
jgi:hypothetical protein